MPMTYSARFSAVTVAASTPQDCFELVAPSDAAIELISCSLAQSSDAGDAEAEMLRVRIARASTSGSGGTTPNKNPHEVGFAASGATVEANNTTQATVTLVMVADVFNAQAGWYYKPIPEERVWLSPSGRLVVSLPTGPLDELTMSGTITWAEYGG